MNFKELLKLAKKDWGNAWIKLTPEEQQHELFKQFTWVVSIQVDGTVETLRGLREIADEILTYVDSVRGGA